VNRFLKCIASDAMIRIPIPVWEQVTGSPMPEPSVPDQSKTSGKATSSPVLSRRAKPRLADTT